MGAHAMAANGCPRYTGDLDVFIEPSPENGTKVIEALARFGPRGIQLTRDEFGEPDMVFRFGHPPRRIGFLTGISGVSFPEAERGSLPVENGGLRVPYLGRDLLIRNKRAAGRPRDLVDADLLEAAPGR